MAGKSSKRKNRAYRGGYRRVRVPDIGVPPHMQGRRMTGKTPAKTG